MDSSPTVQTERAPAVPPAYRAEYARACPGAFFLDASDLPALDDYLQRAGVLESGERVERVVRAGEGNMNCTLRVATNHRSLVVKQARPWIEKYPQFAAPWDRALREIEFYQWVAEDPVVSRSMPQLYHGDTRSRVLVLEDLGARGDYTGIYRGEAIEERAIDMLADYLGALHRLLDRRLGPRHLPNLEMRALNRAHIFFIPLQTDNGLDLESFGRGLTLAAVEMRGDARFVGEVARLSHEVYMGEGSHLVHGDFFPGSFLRTHAGPRVIDPEFCYSGRPEFDVGVFLAHLLLGRQPHQLSERLLARYEPPKRWDPHVVLQLAGVEIMRRLIGYAQLNLGYGAESRLELLRLARLLVLEPDAELLKQF